MIIFCEECGERYIIENEEIKGSEMVFKCRVCKDVIRVPIEKLNLKSDEKAKIKPEKN
ncbi:MAG: zinc-ribbon domain-containing protein [Smithella sp.]